VRASLRGSFITVLLLSHTGVQARALSHYAPFRSHTPALSGAETRVEEMKGGSVGVF